MVERTRLGVLGWPVAHSRSPRMMGAALGAVGLSSWRYQLLPVPPELFAETVRALPGAGFRGANVTIPHKQAALELADQASDTARAIGAANTLLFEPSGAIIADNTDAPAFVDALPINPAGTIALVLGAGGSARAVVWALLEVGAAEVRIWNRHPERARRLCEELEHRSGQPGAAREWGRCRPVADVEPADLMINCTPVGGGAGEPPGGAVRGSLFKQPPLIADELAMFGCVVDFVYGPADTSLARSARDLGIPVVAGLEILVGQGALSFERFTGLAAPLDEMRAAARGR